VIGKNIQGCVLCDQIKSLDWKIRNVEYIEKFKSEIIDEFIEKIKVIIEY